MEIDLGQTSPNLWLMMWTFQDQAPGKMFRPLPEGVRHCWVKGGMELVSPQQWKRRDPSRSPALLSEGHVLLQTRVPRGLPLVEDREVFSDSLYSFL